MVEALGNQQAAEEEKCRHGDFGTGVGAMGKAPEGVQGQIAMSEDDQQGGYQPDDIEIIMLPVQQVVFQSLAVSRP